VIDMLRSEGQAIIVQFKKLKCNFDVFFSLQ
jgi:hypothetical protein